MLDGLTPFARCLAERLFERYPQWQSYAEAVELVSGEGRELRLNVPWPAAQPGPGLWITAWKRDDVTVGFDVWHGHPGLPDDADERVIGQTLGLIDDIIDERIVIGAKLRKGRLLYSRSITLRGEREWRRFKRRWIPWVDRCYWRSWRGTYDRDWSVR